MTTVSPFTDSIAESINEEIMFSMSNTMLKEKAQNSSSRNKSAIESSIGVQIEDVDAGESSKRKMQLSRSNR